MLAGALLLAGGVAAWASSTWTTYHGDAARRGVDPSEPSLSHLKQAWTAALDGASVYGQPVVANGRVFVATEKDDVYALNAHNGKVLWHANIGQPLTNVVTNTGCGDIDPLGITSTPVIDTTTNTLFVVGELSTLGGLPVHHRLFGFNALTGKVVRSASADPVLTAGQNLKHLQQRAALALGHGRVYVAYGGLVGDCGNYHGWIVGVGETGGTNVQFDTTPGAQGGAIWEGGGGPSIDAAGNVYATTGNPNSTSSVTKYGDDIIKLDAHLDASSVRFFHDSRATPNADLDLGTGDATLIPPGTGHTDRDVFAVGKTDYGYLLRRSDLHLVATIPGVCAGGNPDGGEAYDAATDSIYVPCRGAGIQQVLLDTHTLGWRKVGAVDGAPILVAGNLWAAGYNRGPLQELNPATGAVMQTVTTPSLPTFASPSSALGLLLLGTASGVVAFDGPTGPPPSPLPVSGASPAASWTGHWTVSSRFDAIMRLEDT
jgi:outer membrane protein assembly factor BamB